MNFEIQFKREDSIYQWTIIRDVLRSELTPELKEDFEWMESEGKKDLSLEFEITFSPNFPNEPPFIRVVKPIFKFNTDNVTIGGSL